MVKRGETFGEARERVIAEVRKMAKVGPLVVRILAHYQLIRLALAKRRQEKDVREFVARVVTELRR